MGKLVILLYFIITFIPFILFFIDFFMGEGPSNDTLVTAALMIIFFPYIAMTFIASLIIYLYIRVRR